MRSTDILVSKDCKFILREMRAIDIASIMTPFGGWGCAFYGAGVSPGKRASPSNCRVLTIDWQVRGVCRCLWYARGLCLCPCVITPRGFTSLQTQKKKISSRRTKIVVTWVSVDSYSKWKHVLLGLCWHQVSVRWLSPTAWTLWFVSFSSSVCLKTKNITL